jgi:putative ABC transport system permease protein
MSRKGRKGMKLRRDSQGNYATFAACFTHSVGKKIVEHPTSSIHRHTVLFKIIVKNILHKPLGTVLSVALLALSSGIISLLLLLQRQLEQKFENDLKGIDIVVGAKGSPLQLVLSAVYHIDAPTGNIKQSDLQKIARNPMIAQIIPLAYGDSYRSYRILGTDSNYIQKYEAKYAQGRVFRGNLEAVLGANVAASEGLRVGDTFAGTHGQAQEGEEHAEHPYRVVGILQPGGTVLDNLVLTNIESVWSIHEEGHAHHEAEGSHEDHAHEGHVNEDHAHEGEAAPDRELTAVLLKCKSPMGTLTLPRLINETTAMQAAIPALEINRLFSLMGLGVATMQALALAIMLISGFSVFIALYNRLKERRYELALLRSMGCSRGKIFFLLIAEGLLLAILGFAGGMVLSRLGIWALNRTAAHDFHHAFSYKWVQPEAWLLLVTLAVGGLAALIPALKAFNMNLSTTLADA